MTNSIPLTCHPMILIINLCSSYDSHLLFRTCVIDIIQRRVGIQRMKDKFDILRQHNVMIGALNQPKFNYESLQISDTTPIEVLPIDLEFATFALSAMSK